MLFIGRSRKIPLLKRRVRPRRPLGLAFTRVRIDPVAMVFLQCSAEYFLERYFKFLRCSARAGNRNKVNCMDSSMFKVFCKAKMSHQSTIDSIVNQYLTDAEKQEYMEWEAT
ncbi:protein of unknown function [Taphrina deformans PYCC 5710]|uniref:Uncharacterized protein n=1 Tax=Taphrina deformans (strain PYCC 5710 / ATCC 11124 / CBS 356.35 / IMI 108563 / JCM 9778 / NBRC 8474) TaxID=1097556 RepID=R4XH18_TAPDE|nr:protein of unknown function [Taphrina deformans PYCC 5710]|eukprot:CCG83813.1 protein of unknown function [Taphrina deformans PYCC 5710]